MVIRLSPAEKGQLGGVVHKSLFLGRKIIRVYLIPHKVQASVPRGRSRLDPLPRWVSRIRSPGFANLEKIQAYRATGFWVGWILISLLFIFSWSIPAHRKEKRRAALGKLVHAISKSAKSLPPLRLSHTIQQGVSALTARRLIKWFAPKII